MWKKNLFKWGNLKKFFQKILGNFQGAFDKPAFVLRGVFGFG